MKCWLKIQALPLLVYFIVIFWLASKTSLALWEIALSVAFFTLVPVVAALFYGHAVGEARHQQQAAVEKEVSC